MIRILCGEPVTGKGGLALLFLRVVAGSAFILHGWPKFQNAFHWMPPESGIPPIFQALAAFSEFAGGMALVIGLLTRLAALGIWFTMAVAIQFHVSKGDPFVGTGSSWELAAVYLAIMTALVLRGAGAYSLDGLCSAKCCKK